jgi:electron transfer flavoprotein alpha subunit
MKILVFAEQRDNVFKKSAFEVVRAARDLADKTGGEAIGVAIGNGIASQAGKLGLYGAGSVKVVEHPNLGLYSASAYAKVISEVSAKTGASVVFLSATSMGKDLGPRVAVRLDAGLAADCTSLEVQNEELVATRPVYAGKAFTSVNIKSAAKVFTLRPNVFSAGTGGGAEAPVEKMNITLSDADFKERVTEVTKSAGKLDVAEADIIVSGGRGMKGPEHFHLIEELAGALGGAVGASRAVVDAGWRPHSEQVGQTGKTVSPSLYVAVGISGAIQHLAGMSSSKYIVAINKDKDAPIFQVADYGIVGDAFEVLPALTAEVKKLLGK